MKMNEKEVRKNRIDLSNQNLPPSLKKKERKIY